MFLNKNKKYALSLALTCLGFLSVPTVNAQIVSNTSLKFCSQIAVFGPGKAVNCLNESGQYIDSNGNISNVNNLAQASNQANVMYRGIEVPLIANANSVSSAAESGVYAGVQTPTTTSGQTVIYRGIEVPVNTVSTPTPMPKPQLSNPVNNGGYAGVQTPVANYPVVNANNAPACPKFTTGGDSNCINRDGKFVDVNGRVVNNGGYAGVQTPVAPVANFPVINANNAPACPKFTTGGDSNCINRDGKFVDANGRVVGDSGFTGVPTTPVYDPVINANNAPACPKFTTGGDSNCINRDGKFVDANGKVVGNNAVATVMPTLVETPSGNNIRECDKVEVVGPSTPTDCMDRHGNYVDKNGNIINNNTMQSLKPTLIDNAAKPSSNTDVGMTENYSVLSCANVVENLMLKGQADYLPLWEPPQQTVVDYTFALEPVFHPTDLIYNGINYGKGAVLLSQFTKTNQKTGMQTSISDTPVAMNECNIEWIVPESAKQEIARRAQARAAAAAANSGGGKPTFGPGNGVTSDDIGFLGIDAKGVRQYKDGSNDEKYNSQETRDWMLEKLNNNQEGGYGMGWNDMEWNAGSGLWVPSGIPKDPSVRVY